MSKVTVFLKKSKKSIPEIIGCFVLMIVIETVLIVLIKVDGMFQIGTLAFFSWIGIVAAPIFCFYTAYEMVSKKKID